MKKEHCLALGLVVLGAGYWLYWHKNMGNKTHRGALTGNHKGYTSMMKIHPNYYNATSVEGGAWFTNEFNPDTGAPTPWVLGHNGGDGSLINAGWTNWGDAYADRVSQQIKATAVAGSHL